MLTFFDGATTAGQAPAFTVGSYKTLVVHIYGTATARTVNFYSANPNDELIPLLGYNITTGDISASTSGTTSETWQFDISGLFEIVIDINSISGGNLTVKGTAVV